VHRIMRYRDEKQTDRHNAGKNPTRDYMPSAREIKIKSSERKCK